MTKKRGSLIISPELLLSRLNMAGEIVDIRIDHFGGGFVEIIISNESFSDCPEGAYPMPLNLIDF